MHAGMHHLVPLHVMQPDKSVYVSAGYLPFLDICHRGQGLLKNIFRFIKSNNT